MKNGIEVASRIEGAIYYLKLHPSLSEEERKSYLDKTYTELEAYIFDDEDRRAIDYFFDKIPLYVASPEKEIWRIAKRFSFEFNSAFTTREGKFLL